jgi:hypothetical protein
MRKCGVLLLAVLLMLTAASCKDADAIPEPEVVTNEERLGYSGGNISAGGGLMAYGDDGYIYYRSEADHWQLYKAKSDGSTKQKLSEDMPSNINVIGGWVYYTSFSDNFSIYRIRTDGTERQLLGKEYCDDLYVTDRKIYAGIRDINNQRKIIRMDHTGENIEVITEGASLGYYYNENIYYYSNDLSLWKFDLLNKTRTQLTDVYSTYVFVDDTGVYYWRPDENTFNRISLDGKDEVIIRNGDCFNYGDGSVYYMKLGYNNYNFFRYDVKEKAEVQLTKFTGEIWNSSTGEVVEGVDIYNTADIFNNPDGGVLFFNDGSTNVYMLGDKPYFRGTLLECLKETGGNRVDCLFTFIGDNELIVWD